MEAPRRIHALYSVPLKRYSITFVKVEQNTTKSSDELDRLLAKFLIGLKVDDRLPTVRRLALEHGSSPASIHAALWRIEEGGAVTIERRGRLGTFLRERRLDRLWTAAERQPLVLALPLPSTPRYEGLATGLKTVLTDTGIECFLIFVRGSRQRMQALRQGRCHVAIMSSFAAGELCSHHETSTLELPVGSFVKDHRVFYADSRVPTDRPLHVVVDRDSLDQQLLTELQFEDQAIELVPATYIQFARLLKEGHAHAAVWSTDEMDERRPPGISDQDLSERVRQRIGTSDTRASLVARTANVSVRVAVTEGIDVSSVMDIQQKVIAGDIVPEY